MTSSDRYSNTNHDDYRLLNSIEPTESKKPENQKRNCNKNSASHGPIELNLMHKDHDNSHIPLFQLRNITGSRSKKLSFCIAKEINNGARCRRMGADTAEMPNLRSKFASPTDRLLSPCSKKLNDHKAKLFGSKSKPMKLSFSEFSNDHSDDEL